VRFFVRQLHLITRIALVAYGPEPTFGVVEQ
jgi:hypothetical protein